MSVRTFQNILPTQGERVFIDDTALVIGDVVLGDDVSVWPMTVIRGDVNKIRIGARSNVQDGCVCHVSHANSTHPNGFALTIGEEVTIGHKAIVHGCSIGNRVLIGMGVIIMDGATIPDEVILGAGSLVAPGKILESGFLYVGSPAKKVRELTSEEKTYLTYSAQHYVSLKNKYL